MPNRTLNLPGKYSRDEIDLIVEVATKSGLSPVEYVRKRLRLPPVKMGAPPGNKNNPHGRRGSEGGAQQPLAGDAQ